MSGIIKKESMNEIAIKSGCSEVRGHPVEWTGEMWVYSDNKQPLPSDGGKERPCIKCGQKERPGKGGVDQCLGVLPGVDNACCGHGNPEYSYIRFTNGVVVTGFVVNTTKQEADSKKVEL